MKILSDYTLLFIKTVSVDKNCEKRVDLLMTKRLILFYMCDSSSSVSIEAFNSQLLAFDIIDIYLLFFICFYFYPC